MALKIIQFIISKVKELQLELAGHNLYSNKAKDYKIRNTQWQILVQQLTPIYKERKILLLHKMT